MDKTILKKFAIESRQDLMKKIESKIKLFYVDETFSKQQNGDVYVLSNEKHTLNLSKEEYEKRELLIKRIKELGIEQVIEEAAYTWFNRIVAIRYMEINDYLPLTKDNQSLGIRVLSSKDNTPDPEIMKFTNLTNPDLDIDFKKERYIELKDDNEKYKYVLLLVCKKLGKVIPQVFDGITDYIDLLIPDNLLNDSGFINKIITEIREENYNRVEIIGWLYQYYNQTEKDRVINAKKAYKKNEIPYATQLFTPDWIVKYMVENTLGKYWIEHKGNRNLIEKWKYYVDDDNIVYKKEIDPSLITCFDPCMGSGHILVYFFEILYQIYESYGYSKKDIPRSILKNNIFGLDIDNRAGQLSILSLILKAREYDKYIFNDEIISNLNILSVQDYNLDNINLFINYDEETLAQVKYLNDAFIDAKEIGSLIKVKNNDYSKLEKYIEDEKTIFGFELKNKLVPLIKQAKILSNKYSIVVTNPPYMNNKYMSNKIKEFAQKNYFDYKNDLFSMFMVKCFDFCIEDGMIGMISPFVWMFIQSYSKLRQKIVFEKKIDSLIQLEYNAFEVACVPVCTYVFKNNYIEDNGTFIRLSDFPGADIQEMKTLEALNDKTCNYKYKVPTKEFKNTPDNIISYWIPNNLYKIFANSKKIGDYGLPKKGLSTGDNNKFLRLWYEVDYNKIGYNLIQYDENYKWIPLNKGGDYRRWYGNNDYVINWNNNGRELKEFNGSVIRNEQFYFKKSITWTMLSSKLFGVRASGTGKIFEGAGPSLFVNDENYEYILGLMLSKVGSYFINVFNPTMNINISDISNIPVIYNEKLYEEIKEHVIENIKIEKEEWNTYERSNDFKKSPLLFEKNNSIYQALLNYEKLSNLNYDKLKTNEELLNDLFINMYSLNSVINNQMSKEEITFSIKTKKENIIDFISYAVGCMFGRYSLDKDGLIYAGGEFDENNYKTFKADSDNIIPITDEAYFADDIVARFKEFIEIVYGKDSLNANLDFIAETLGKKGTETSEETIRRYFLNDFYSDHIKMYQKKPIYWLFDSGKKNGFKALIYMHRYNENTVPKVRLDYLHRVQNTYDKLLTDVNYKLTTDLSVSDKKIAQNRQADLNAKLQEITAYDEKIAHIANQRISIDLDDGVTANYSKFEDILAKIK